MVGPFLKAAFALAVLALVAQICPPTPNGSGSVIGPAGANGAVTLRHYSGGACGSAVAGVDPVAVTETPPGTFKFSFSGIDMGSTATPADYCVDIAYNTGTGPSDVTGRHCNCGNWPGDECDCQP